MLKKRSKSSSSLGHGVNDVAAAVSNPTPAPWGNDVKHPMRRRTRRRILLGLSVAISVQAVVTYAKPSRNDGKTIASSVSRGDPAIGRDKAEAERCVACHGSEGQGPEPVGDVMPPIYAKLAGLSPQYITEQIRNFRSGVRKHDTMRIVARNLDDEDLADIAAYFASQARLRGDVPPAGAKPSVNGDAQRVLAACVSCHGEGGKGSPNDPTAPLLAGQQKAYLREQLLDMRSGKRIASPASRMNQTAKTLSDSDIEALADYLSNL